MSCHRRWPDQLLLVVALSMLITPLLFIVYDLLSRRMNETDEARSG